MPLNVLKETEIVDSLLSAAQSHVVIAEMNHYIRLSKDAPVHFDRLRMLVDFLHAVTRDN